MRINERAGNHRIGGTTLRVAQGVVAEGQESSRHSDAGDFDPAAAGDAGGEAAELRIAHGVGGGLDQDPAQPA
jgi:hypothetical protein